MSVNESARINRNAHWRACAPSELLASRKLTELPISVVGEVPAVLILGRFGSIALSAAMTW